MATEISYDYLYQSSKNIEDAAEYCQKYAAGLRRKVTNQLDSLTRGSSEYTRNASYFTAQKIKCLDQQQQRCRTISNNIHSFISEAQTVDQHVARFIKTDGNDFRKAKGLTYGKADCFMQTLFGFAAECEGKGGLAKIFMSGLRIGSDSICSAYRNVKHWYHCEGGKYVVSAVIRTIGVVIAITAAFAALVVVFGLTAAGWAAFVAICTAVAACIALADSVVSLVNSINAARIARYDPGWAARYAETTSLSEQLKKRCYDSRWANILSNYAAISVDVIGGICGFVSTANMFVNATKFFTNSYRANANWKRYFNCWNDTKSYSGFSLKKFLSHPVKNIKGLKFAFNHDFQYTQWKGARKRNHSVYEVVQWIRELDFFKHSTKIYKFLKKLA